MSVLTNFELLKVCSPHASCDEHGRRHEGSALDASRSRQVRFSGSSSPDGLKGLSVKVALLYCLMIE